MDNTNDTAVVYWIHLPEHHDPKHQGYVGVSKNLPNRLKSHLLEISSNSHKNVHLHNAVLKYGWSLLLKEVIFTANEEECYIREKELRPVTGIGWNIAPGGHRGPGRKKGHKVDPKTIEKQKEMVRLRRERILTNNLSDSDLIFLEKKREKSLLREKKKNEKIQAKIQEKLLKKQQMILEKQATKAAIDKEKTKNRTRGVVITEQQNRPLCLSCKVRLAKSNGTSKHGFKQWHKYCVCCAKAIYNSKYGYLKQKKDKCEQCGFEPQDLCQLDLVYLDGDNKNKKEDNLKTLCANCGRLHQKELRIRKKVLLDITVDADVRI